MIRTNALLAAAMLAALMLPAGASQANGIAQSDAGFVVKLSADTNASPADTWRMLIAPAKWWSSDHTWSRDAANLYLDAQASVCFCEKLLKSLNAPAGQRIDVWNTCMCSSPIHGADCFGCMDRWARFRARHSAAP